jgi:hypothetical protein
MNMPRSNALAEAEPLSTQELFSRDPERLADANIDEIILYMRDLRVRIEASGAMASKTRVKKEAVKVDTSGLFDEEE